VQLEISRELFQVVKADDKIDVTFTLLNRSSEPVQFLIGKDHALFYVPSSGAEWPINSIVGSGACDLKTQCSNQQTMEERATIIEPGGARKVVMTSAGYSNLPKAGAPINLRFHMVAQQVKYDATHRPMGVGMWREYLLYETALPLVVDAPK